MHVAIWQASIVVVFPYITWTGWNGLTWPSHNVTTHQNPKSDLVPRYRYPGTGTQVQCCLAIVIPTVFHPWLDILDPYPYPYPWYPYPWSRTRTHTHIYGLVPIPVPVPMTLSHVVPVPIPVPMVSYPYPYPYPWSRTPYPYPYPWPRTHTRTRTHDPYPHYKSAT